MLKLRHEKRDVPIIETVASKDGGVDTLLITIDGLLAGRSGDRQKARERRMRRLIAQAAGRLVQDRIGRYAGSDMERLIEAAAAGEIGIAEAAQRALKIIG
jgi:putative protein kinase ArgK-like GTPase of G3E family